jgi:hypothetical protein
MNIQLEINGEPYTGSAFKTNDGILIHLPGVQAASAPPFETLFQGVPENKPNGGFLEVGEWNGKEFSFETQVTFGVGPDGKVWAQVCNTPGELPDAGDSPRPGHLADTDVTALAFKILEEAEEAFNAKSMAKERAANGEWPLPVTVSDYLFWLEDEATIQEDALNRNPHATDMDEAYTRALRGVANELRELGFMPSPEPWSNISAPINSESTR